MRKREKIMIKYKVEKLPNVVEVSNLNPPEWYDELLGGYTYRWINLSHLEYNESVSNESDLKKVYYYGLGSKGFLGYKDGSYYESCKDPEFISMRSDRGIKWKFEVDKFFKLYEDAEYYESLKLRDIDATSSNIYYNGNNGFKKIIEGQTDEVLRLKKDYDEASNYFMSLEPENREGFFNGFECISIEVDTIQNECISYQLPDRQEDEAVINSIYEEVNTNHGDASNIPPIAIMNLNTGILKNDKDEYLEGRLVPAGNHRIKGCKEGGAVKMNAIVIPDIRTSNFGSVEIRQFAMIDNPEPDTPRNPTGEDEYVSTIVDMVSEKNYNINHPEIEKFLLGCGLKSKKKRDKLKKLAREAKKHQRNSTTPIKWASKGWKGEAGRVVENFKSKTSDARVGSVEKFNIEKVMDARTNFAREGLVLEEFTYFMHGKSNLAWEMWDYEKAGRQRADLLVSGVKLDNINGKEIKVIFKRLPRKHASIGVNNSNFWDSNTGSTWLKDEGIVLKKVKK